MDVRQVPLNEKEKIIKTLTGAKNVENSPRYLKLERATTKPTVGDSKLRPLRPPAAPPHQITCCQLLAGRYRSDSGLTGRSSMTTAAKTLYKCTNM